MNPHLAKMFKPQLFQFNKLNKELCLKAKFSTRHLKNKNMKAVDNKIIELEMIDRLRQGDLYLLI